ncbi:MAG: RNA 2',3'-cyclic phosphodiesterase [Candidatus Micrarchaeota archaeon]|nr:RNA 2',3'-cyclic phosphodiesterase [Candidatus Micrarchaeota archaeon]
MDDAVRAFIAIDLPDHIKDGILELDRELEERARPVSKENMHITLLFLGEISEEKILLVKGAMNAVEAKPFKSSVKGVDTLPGRAPRVLFAKIGIGKKEMIDMYGSLANAVRDSGIVIESREYIPHLTIARIKGFDRQAIGEFVERNSSVEFGEFVCDRITLRKSVLTGKGPVYTDLHTRYL